MRANQIDGHIIEIDSIAGHYVPYIPGLDLNVYPASKFAVRALTESFRQELVNLNSGIKVSVSIFKFKRKQNAGCTFLER